MYVIMTKQYVNYIFDFQEIQDDLVRPSSIFYFTNKCRCRKRTGKLGNTFRVSTAHIWPLCYGPLVDCKGSTLYVSPVCASLLSLLPAPTSIISVTQL